MASVKRQHQESVEEASSLEKRVKNMCRNAQSEQDTMSGELKRRDDAIEKLKIQQTALQLTITKQEEKVGYLVHAVYVA